MGVEVCHLEEVEVRGENPFGGRGAFEFSDQARAESEAAALEWRDFDLDGVRSDGYSFQIEMSFRAWRKGFRIVEIPIVFVDRTEGSSKMSKKIVREAVWMVWRLRWWAISGRV